MHNRISKSGLWILLAQSSVASAQCPLSPHGEIYERPPFQAVPSDAVSWDPDAIGPLPPLLVVANFFGVFTWDGFSWRMLGHPDDFAAGARVVAVHNGNLVAASQFAVFQWNSNNWITLGSVTGSREVHIDALRSFQGDLIVAGSFERVGFMDALNVARWDRHEQSGSRA